MRSKGKAKMHLYWGEIHMLERALSCIGVLTSGTIREIVRQKATPQKIMCIFRQKKHTSWASRHLVFSQKHLNNCSYLHNIFWIFYLCLLKNDMCHCNIFPLLHLWCKSSRVQFIKYFWCLSHIFPWDLTEAVWWWMEFSISSYTNPKILSIELCLRCRMKAFFPATINKFLKVPDFKTLFSLYGSFHLRKL